MYNQLGLCKLKGGDYEAALAAFQAGLEVEGNTATQSLMFNELVAYEYLGQYDKMCIRDRRIHRASTRITRLVFIIFRKRCLLYTSRCV